MNVMSLGIRGSKGLELLKIPEICKKGNSSLSYESDPTFTNDTSKTVKALAFSPDGNYLSWSNGQSLVVCHYDNEASKWISKFSLDHPRASFLTFSPKGKILCSWETYAIRNGVSQDNVRLWNIQDGTLIHSYINRKMSGWAPQWTKDERISALQANNHIHFYENNQFKGEPVAKLILNKFETFSFSGKDEKSGYHIIAFIRGNKDSASFGKLFTFPNFSENQAVANKSLYFAERCEIEWNKDGTSALLLSQAEVDNSDASYYGKQQLHYMNNIGDTCNVQLPKEGPIYHIAWSPTAHEFCVVYGYMPAKVTLFNRKCDKVFDFGTGARNVVYFNPQGSLLLIGGFGNLRGGMEIWDIATKKKVSSFEAPDTTDVKWSPDGQRFVTSTCAPRLRQGNGIKIWHYSSSLLYEQIIHAPDELWEVQWRTSDKSFELFPISKKIVTGIKSATPVASKVAYRPPGARRMVPGMSNAQATTAPKCNFKLHEDEPAENDKEGNSSASISKSSAKNKKRREAAKKKKEENIPAQQHQNGTNDNNLNKTSTTKSTSNETGNLENEKKIRKLNDKLMQIQKLKAQQAEGKQLEVNQIEKIKKEKEIMDEIANLKL